MIGNIDISKIININYMGFDNYSFKYLADSYFYNSKRKFLLKLKKGDLNITEDWFEDTEILSNEKSFELETILKGTIS